MVFIMVIHHQNAIFSVVLFVEVFFPFSLLLLANPLAVAYDGNNTKSLTESTHFHLDKLKMHET